MCSGLTTEVRDTTGRTSTRTSSMAAEDRVSSTMRRRRRHLRCNSRATSSLSPTSSSSMARCSSSLCRPRNSRRLVDSSSSSLPRWDNSSSCAARGRTREPRRSVMDAARWATTPGTTPAGREHRQPSRPSCSSRWRPAYRGCSSLDLWARTRASWRPSPTRDQRRPPTAEQRRWIGHSPRTR